MIGEVYINHQVAGVNNSMDLPVAGGLLIPIAHKRAVLGAPAAAG